MNRPMPAGIATGSVLAPPPHMQPNDRLVMADLHTAAPALLRATSVPSPVGARQALVLGDEPAMTTYLPTERLFLRWAAAYSEAELVAAAKRALAAEPDWDDDEDLNWEVREAVVLFDSAIPGAELEPGRYRVRATYMKDEDNWMILVQLQPGT
ncbi:Imm21 family immunity protein [Nonomuraea sp. NPDC003709]|uniref:Imm21 family immunity protein n=1 Tax=Nonomuraea sp. NPDC003709 TaxID=3154450 RepID=UPI0033A0C6D8